MQILNRIQFKFILSMDLKMLQKRLFPIVECLYFTALLKGCKLKKSMSQIRVFFGTIFYNLEPFKCTVKYIHSTIEKSLLHSIEIFNDKRDSTCMHFRIPLKIAVIQIDRHVQHQLVPNSDGLSILKSKFNTCSIKHSLSWSDTIS